MKNNMERYFKSKMSTYFPKILKTKLGPTMYIIEMVFEQIEFNSDRFYFIKKHEEIMEKILLKV